MNGYHYLGMYPGLAVAQTAKCYPNPVTSNVTAQHDRLSGVVQKINQPQGVKNA